MPPTYLWTCSKCDTMRGVLRPMSQYQVPPEEMCECPEGVLAEWVRTLEPVAITNGDGHKPAPTRKDK